MGRTGDFVVIKRYFELKKLADGAGSRAPHPLSPVAVGNCHVVILYGCGVL